MFKAIDDLVYLSNDLGEYQLAYLTDTQITNH